MFRKIGILLLIIATLFITLRAIVAQTKIPYIKETEHDLLPQEMEGTSPIEIPDYQGVEQLIVLSNRWVIVVTDNIPDIVRKMDELTEGEFSKNVEIWRESEKHHPNWDARGKVLTWTKNLWAQARELAGEKLDETSNFSISSENDERYIPSKNPEKVTRYVASFGDGVLTGKGGYGYPDIYFLQYSYLEFPEPMQNGDRYTITLRDGKRVSFLYDEMRTVSRSIKVNQVGYLPDATHKRAYLGGFLFEYGPLPLPEVSNFFVVSVDTGQVAFQGTAKLIAQNPQVEGGSSKPLFSGEDIYELDFTGLQEEGNFFISIPSVGRSWSFRHAKDAYGEAFYVSARALYHQRAGMEIGLPYSAWNRQAYHTDPVFESEHVPFTPPVASPKDYNAFDVIGGTIDLSRSTNDATGGWYDAADWDRNITHYANVFDMLYAYEIYPEKFYDGQLNLPESSNSIPDILDEVEYGLLVWKKSMNEYGGVAGIVETWTHPAPDDPKVQYAYSIRARWSSLIYAAAAAQFAYLVRPFSEEKYIEYMESALKAYSFGTNPENALKDFVIHAKKNRGAGESYTFTFTEKDEEISPFIIHAKLRLYLLTEDKKYLEGIPELLSNSKYKPYQWPFTLQGYSPWIYISIFNPKIAPQLPVLLLNQWMNVYLKIADDFVKQADQQAYHFSWPLDRDFWMAWGATTMTNHARALLIAHYLTGQKKYRDAALQNIGFMLGANPLGISWTTGLGYVYPIDIQHETSRRDGIIDPVPGITIYGFTGVYPGHFRDALWQTRDANGEFVNFMKQENWNLPLWRRWAPHPYLNVPQNEFTIHETIASTIFCYAVLLPEGWMPSESLKNRKPRRDDLLFGLWYLP